MQCPNCRFENMPEIHACGRCGASLRLATATIDVHPPRAGKRAAWWRSRLLRRAGYGLRDALQGGVPRISPSDIVDVPETPVLLRLAVPGWAQFYFGRRLLGWVLLGGFIAFLMLGVVFIGTQFGSLMLGLAIACHTSSIVDVVNHAAGSVRRRTAVFLACAGVVALVVYLPATWLISRLAVPQVIMQTLPPFDAGDVVLYAPGLRGWPAIGSGDVVLYSPPGVRVALGDHRQLVVRGDRIDRVLATSGQTASWKNGALEIDGQPSNLKPLNPGGCPYSLSVTVPQGTYLILPSSLDATRAAQVAGGPREMSLIPQSQVRGRVFLQSQPLSRFSWIR